MRLLVRLKRRHRVVLPRRADIEHRSKNLDQPVRRAQELTGELALDLRIPGFLLILRADRIEPVEPVFEVRRHHAPSRVRDLASLGDHILAVPGRPQIVEHLFAILGKRALGEPKANDDEVCIGFACRKWLNPARLAATLEPNFAGERTGHRACSLQCRRGIVRQQVKVLRVTTLRFTGTALVIDEHANAARGQQILHSIEEDGRVALRPVHQHSDWNRPLKPRHHQPPRKLQPMAFERRIGDVKRLPPPGTGECPADNR